MRRCMLAGRSLCGLFAIGRPTGRTVRSRTFKPKKKAEWTSIGARSDLRSYHTICLAYSSLHVVTLRRSARVVQEPAGGLRVAAGQMLSMKSPEHSECSMLTGDGVAWRRIPSDGGAPIDRGQHFSV
jgi:hypothetical protein